MRDDPAPAGAGIDQERMGHLRYLVTLVEEQVRFGDTKGSLLLAGDALLLSVATAVMTTALSCEASALPPRCSGSLLQLVLSGLAALLLLVSLTLALVAARPNRIHLNPKKEMFLFSWIGKESEQDFVNAWRGSTNDALETDLLRGVHGKSCYARRKFARLRSAITATLAALPLIALGIGVYAFRMITNR